MFTPIIYKHFWTTHCFFYLADPWQKLMTLRLGSEVLPSSWWERFSLLAFLHSLSTCWCHSLPRYNAPVAKCCLVWALEQSPRILVIQPIAKWQGFIDPVNLPFSNFLMQILWNRIKHKWPFRTTIHAMMAWPMFALFVQDWSKTSSRLYFSLQRTCSYSQPFPICRFFPWQGIWPAWPGLWKPFQWHLSPHPIMKQPSTAILAFTKCIGLIMCWCCGFKN